MQVENTDFTVGSDYMLSRLVVSLIIKTHDSESRGQESRLTIVSREAKKKQPYATNE